MIEVRKIKKTDYLAVERLIRAAFSSNGLVYGNEAELVGKIRQLPTYDNELELVALKNNDIIGHGLLSEVEVENGENHFTGLVLAPLAVLPEAQKSGIGKILMQQIEQAAQAKNYPFISILGHPAYYAKFGYQPASKFNIYPPFEVPDEAFMIKAIRPDGLKNVQGNLHYNVAFAE